MMKRKKLKGFTLLELILVMAIFGILMAAVMSIIKPLNKLSKRTSIQEANAAAVDNIKSYFESSMRYADCIEAFPEGLTDNDGYFFMNKEYYSDQKYKNGFGLENLSGKTTKDKAMEAAVVNFIDNHYTNRVKPNVENKADPLTGRVRMLKIDNNNGGKVEETEWKFTAGYTYTNYYTEDTVFEGTEYKKGDVKMKKDDNGQIVQDIGRVHAKLEHVSTDPSVINSTYYEYYSFYIAPGYNNIETLFDVEGEDADTYYGALKPVVGKGGNTYSDFSKDMFSLSVVTYKNDDDVEYRSTAVLKDYKGEDDTFVTFRSPYAISNSNMSLININSEFSSIKNSDNYGPVRYNGVYIKDGKEKEYTPDTLVPGKNNNWLYEKITSSQAAKISERVYVHGVNDTAEADKNKVEDKDYECIYFIYTLPDFV